MHFRLHYNIIGVNNLHIEISYINYDRVDLPSWMEMMTFDSVSEELQTVLLG